MRSPLFRPTDQQRSALLARAERLRQPMGMLELLRSALPPGLAPAAVVACTPGTAHPDRFVLRVQARAESGEERIYAVKAYGDDVVERIWTFTQAVAERITAADTDGLSLPIAYAKGEQALIAPWVEGVLLSEITDARTAPLLSRAASLTAALHRLAVVPEPPTTPAMLIDETRARRDRLRTRWPETIPLVDALLEELLSVAPSLDPAEPAAVHGDLGGAQFVWTGTRLVLFDWDRFGYTDPAFDVGHFLAQLDRVCIVDAALRVYASDWCGSFLDRYVAAMPRVSLRNVAFYRAMTLLWKIHTICRVRPASWPELVPQLARAAHAVLQAGASPDPTP